MLDRILVIGSEGQLGSELVGALSKNYGHENVIRADIRLVIEDAPNQFIELDVLDYGQLKQIISQQKITQIYHLAALLSAKGEQNPSFAWQLNVDGLLNVLNLSVEFNIKKVYWPSSIAVFGPGTPRENTPQDCFMDPNTVYGISKLAGELWCRYYFEKHGLDVRSLRYPGLISYKTPPGGGTTDYAVDIFYQLIEKGSYECFLSENTELPMMYMDDAVRATIDLMEAPAEKVKIHTSYNISAISFTPNQLVEEIKKHYPNFEVSYKPDHRQKIADSWPGSIDDSTARNQWGWNHEFDLAAMTKAMIEGLRK